MEFAVQHKEMNRSSCLLEHPFLETSIKHYSNSSKILLFGEGDFSFSVALANAFGSAKNMVPTSLDSREKVLQSYKSAQQTLSILDRLGAMILHGVDATKMGKHHIVKRMSFDRIVYNFPHAGFHGKDDNERVIRKHRHLLKMFFKNATTMLSGSGEIHVTHKEYGPYKKWELVKQAEKSGLILKGSVRFKIANYPGYTNRKGAGPNAGETFFLGKCQTYKFVLGPDILYKRELMTIPVVLPNVSSEASAESFGDDILEPESKRQVRMAGKMTKLDSETSSNYFKMHGNEGIIRSEGFARQRNDTLHNNAQTWRIETKIAERSDEALTLRDDTIKRKGSRLKRSILKLESKRQARKAVETEKTGFETTSNHFMVIPDILDKQELMAVQVLQQNVSSQPSVENFEAENLKSESESEARMAGEMAKVDSETLFTSSPDSLYRRELKANQVASPNISTEVYAANFKVDILESQSERQAKMAGEMEKVDSGASFKYLKMIANEEINRSGEFAREINHTFHQNAQTWRVETKIAEQLYEAINSKQVAIRKTERSFEEPILEVESERQARKATETENDGLERTLNHVIAMPDIRYKWELMANQVVLPNISSEAYTEEIKVDILKSKSKMQARTVGEIAKAYTETFFTSSSGIIYKQQFMAIQVISPNISSEIPAEIFKGDILEHGSGRQLRMAKTDSETSFNYWKMVADKEICPSDEFGRERNKTLHQSAETCRVETKIAEQLDKASNLKEDTIKRNLETNLKEAILELEAERYARKAAETEKAGLETMLNHLKVNLKRESNKSDELERQRDEVLCQLAEASREKQNIAKQLDEVSGERNDALHQKEESWRQNERIAKQLAEALRLNENAVKQKDAKLKEAMSELEFERQARKSGEAEKTYLEIAFNQMRVFVNKELEKNQEWKRKRDEALYHKEEACREKTMIAKQLDAALRLKEDAVEQIDKIVWQQKGLSHY